MSRLCIPFLLKVLCLLIKYRSQRFNPATASEQKHIGVSRYRHSVGVFLVHPLSVGNLGSDSLLCAIPLRQLATPFKLRGTIPHIPRGKLRLALDERQVAHLHQDFTRHLVSFFTGRKESPLNRKVEGIVFFFNVSTAGEGQD